MDCVHKVCGTQECQQKFKLLLGRCYTGILTDLALKRRVFQLAGRCSFCCSEEDWWHLFLDVHLLVNGGEIWWDGLNTDAKISFDCFWEQWMGKKEMNWEK